MSKEISLQAGQWYRNREGTICYCIGPLKRVENRFMIETANGLVDEYERNGIICKREEDFDDDDENYWKHLDLVEHLPGCDGFDWEPPKPKLQLREGAWYKRKDGNIVGPCEPCDVSTTALTGGKARWRIGTLWYGDDGTCPVESNWLVNEVDAPKPKYRPFANAEEFKPHRDKWWRWKSDIFLQPPAKYSCTSHGMNGFPFMFDKAEFEDGSPFGVEVTE